MTIDKVYQKHFSDSQFWKKTLNGFKKAGKIVIEKALWLYYAAQKPETPVWAKTAIFAALGYFICPLDAIPDITPGVGYIDDLGVLTSAVAAVSMYIDQDVKNKAAEKIRDWFGDL